MSKTDNLKQFYEHYIGQWHNKKKFEDLTIQEKDQLKNTLSYARYEAAIALNEFKESLLKPLQSLLKRIFKLWE